MNGLMDFNSYIIDHFSIVRNIFSIENVGMLIIPKTYRSLIILNDILLFLFTFVGGLLKYYFVSNLYIEFV